MDTRPAYLPENGSGRGNDVGVCGFAGCLDDAANPHTVFFQSDLKHMNMAKIRISGQSAPRLKFTNHKSGFDVQIAGRSRSHNSSDMSK